MTEIIHDIDRPDAHGNLPKMHAIANVVRERLKNIVPELSVTTNDNLMSSIFIRGSFDPQNEWRNGIFENSRYFHLRLSGPRRYYNDGDPITSELISGSGVSKYRKYTSNPEKVIAKLAQYLRDNK